MRRWWERRGEGRCVNETARQGRKRNDGMRRRGSRQVQLRSSQAAASNTALGMTKARAARGASDNEQWDYAYARRSWLVVQEQQSGNRHMEEFL